MRTRRLSLATLALALPLTVLPALQDARGGRPQETGGRGQEQEEGADPKEEAKRDIFGRRVVDRTKATPSERLLGCWQLVNLQIEGFPTLGTQGAGFLLVHEGFLALELHLTWGDVQNAPDIHQTFIAEWTLTPDRRLQLNTVIGSYLDDITGDLEWERRGFAREYHVTQTDRRLTLEFGTGNRMVFAPRFPATSRERDIYGRPLKEATSDRDIFGRRLERGESDAPREGAREGAGARGDARGRGGRE